MKLLGDAMGKYIYDIEEEKHIYFDATIFMQVDSPTRVKKDAELLAHEKLKDMLKSISFFGETGWIRNYQIVRTVSKRGVWGYEYFTVVLYINIYTTIPNEFDNIDEFTKEVEKVFGNSLEEINYLGVI